MNVLDQRVVLAPSVKISNKEAVAPALITSELSISMQPLNDLGRDHPSCHSERMDESRDKMMSAAAIPFKALMPKMIW